MIVSERNSGDEDSTKILYVSVYHFWKVRGSPLGFEGPLSSAAPLDFDQGLAWNPRTLGF